jgi:L-amino acid N-acyltransferase YncA
MTPDTFVERLLRADPALARRMPASAKRRLAMEFQIWERSGNFIGYALTQEFDRRSAAEHYLRRPEVVDAVMVERGLGGARYREICKC